MAISVLAYHPDREVEEVADPDAISDLRGRDDCLLWVDLIEPTDEDMHCVQVEFDLHPLAMEDARKHGQRPKLERYPTHAFLVAYSCLPAEVDLFVGPDWLVTVREQSPVGQTWPLERARSRFERIRPESATVGALLYVVLDELVDGYFEAVEGIEDRLQELEDEVFEERLRHEREMQRDLFGVRRDLLNLRRKVVPLREVLAALLRKEVKWLDEQTLVHLQDVYDHVLRAMDLIDAQRELMTNTMEAHLAIVSNRMNRAMEQMTSWGAILLGATLVAGIYGMNFEHMPELGWPLGYPFALSIMLFITVGGYRFFKRRDWL